jgi:hypothetical protein
VAIGSIPVVKVANEESRLTPLAHGRGTGFASSHRDSAPKSGFCAVGFVRQIRHAPVKPAGGRKIIK